MNSPQTSEQVKVFGSRKTEWLCIFGFAVCQAKLSRARRFLKRFPAYFRSTSKVSRKLVAIVLRNAWMHSKVKGLFISQSFFEAVFEFL